jgi:pRiA4b ORF-3-like protein
MPRAAKKAAARKKASARSPRGAKPARGPGRILQFKITLEGIAPPIWRRIQVPADYTFWDLHVAIQDAMGWDDCHLHQFVFHGEDESSYVYLGIPDDEGVEGEADILPGWEYRVIDQLERPGDCVVYEYDFGDAWEHAILLEEILPPARGGRYPRCVAGERACPPEDCGGAHGYARLLAVLRDPKHKAHEELLAWVGGSYDPEAFSPGLVKFHDPRRRLKAILGAE